MQALAGQAGGFATEHLAHCQTALATTRKIGYCGRSEAGRGNGGVEAMSQTKPGGLFSKPANRVVLLVLLAIGAASTTGLVLARRDAPVKAGPTGGQNPNPPPKELKDFAAKYFPNWPADRKPELLLIFTGQQHNYEAPCGCTEPQFGGLERRYNLFQHLRNLGLKIVAADLGDIYYPGKLPEQARLKYATLMKAMDLMKY